MRYLLYAAVILSAVLLVLLWRPGGDPSPRPEFYGSPMAAAER